MVYIFEFLAKVWVGWLQLEIQAHILYQEANCSGEIICCTSREYTLLRSVKNWVSSEKFKKGTLYGISKTLMLFYCFRGLSVYTRNADPVLQLEHRSSRRYEDLDDLVILLDFRSLIHVLRDVAVLRLNCGVTLKRSWKKLSHWGYLTFGSHVHVSYATNGVIFANLVA